MTDFTESYGYNILKGMLSYPNVSWKVSKIPASFKLRYGFDAVLQRAVQWNADVIIGRFEKEDDLKKFEENGILAIAQDYRERLDSIPNITGGYLETGAMAADFFLEKRHHNFAFLGYKDVVWSEERMEGYLARLRKMDVREKNISVYLDTHFDDLMYDSTDEIARWITELPKPVAVFCCDDNMASDLIDICNWTGIHIPDEVAILGVDNSEVASKITDPPLSSISLDTANATYKAAAKIEAVLKGKGKWNNENFYVLPISVINRMSTDNFPVSDSNIVKALKFISQNLSNRIRVSDVVEQVPMSRRLLEIRFRQHTGKSILQYINESKLDAFAQLLINTDEPVVSLAASVGLEDTANISRLFKKVYGCSPSEYRKNNR